MVRKRKAFSLIELLVVVAIMGVLVTIAVPSYMGYRARVRNSVASYDASNYQVAQEAFKSSTAGLNYVSLVAPPAACGGTFCGCLCSFAWAPSKVQGVWNKATSVVMLGPAANPIGYKAVLAHPSGSMMYTVTHGVRVPTETACGAACPTAGASCTPGTFPCDCPAVGGGNPACNN